MQPVQYFHQSTYGHMGETHTMKPQYMMKGNGIYATRWNNSVPDRTQALYRVEGNRLYATTAHPDGKSAHALYEIRGDKIHTTVHNAEHNASQHVFELKTHP